MSDHDEPFMEHPSGKFPDAVAAMRDAIERLRALQTWDRWITFSGQGQVGRLDSYHIADVRVLGDTIDPGVGGIDLRTVLEVGGFRMQELQVRMDAHGRMHVVGATPEQFARLLDGLFRGQLGVREFEDEGDYAVGAEW